MIYKPYIYTLTQISITGDRPQSTINDRPFIFLTTKRSPLIIINKQRSPLHLATTKRSPQSKINKQRSLVSLHL
ncbi:MAG: hypothetical protein ACOYN8_19400 [Pseudanabaena sp.]